MMSQTIVLPLYTVDAFSEVPFAGNQAAVCLDSQGLSVDMMQKIAAEMNIAETAFVLPLGPNGNFTDSSRFGLRWFTPQTEVPLCGHATLASAAVLFNCVKNKNNEVTFESQKKGELKAKRNGEKVTLDFPLGPPEVEDMALYADLLKVTVADLPVLELQFSPLTSKLLVRLDNSVTREQLESLPVPNPSVMISTHNGKVKGVIVTMKSESSSGYDFFSRYFAPWVGLPEDPVTGSAHTVLAPYWGEVLNKKTLKARQCSPRGGDVELELRSDGRVNITGSTTVVIKGTITV